MSRSWALSKMIGYDLESTGVDVETARIVSASVIIVEPDVETLTHSWLVDPGIEIPEDAAALHGITTERARADGIQSARALTEIAEVLEGHWTPDVPLVGYNVSYDLSLSDREWLRHGLPSLVEPLLTGGVDRYVVDPLVIDRKVDRYRKGGRKLDAVCRHYGVELVDAHTSDADTLATLRLAYRLAARYSWISEMSLATLHARQQRWHADWGNNMRTFLRREAAAMGQQWMLGKSRPDCRAAVLAKLAKLEITGEPTDELIETTIAQTLARSEEFGLAGTQWPMRPRPALGDTSRTAD